MPLPVFTGSDTQNQFNYIRHTDRWLLWINILLLMFVDLISFSAALLGEYPSQKLSIDFYGANLIITRLLLFLNWWYATGKGHLVNDDIDPLLVKLYTGRILAAPMLYLVAIAVSFINTDVTILLYALITIAYMLPGRIDREWLTADKVAEKD